MRKMYFASHILFQFLCGLFWMSSLSTNLHSETNRYGKTQTNSHHMSPGRGSSSRTTKAPEKSTKTKSIFQAFSREEPAPRKSNTGGWLYDSLVAQKIATTEMFKKIKGKDTYGTCTNIQTISASDKKKWFQALFRAIAKAESDFQPSARPKSGIMQLSCNNTERVSYRCNCKSSEDFRKSGSLSVTCAMNIVDFHFARGRGIFFNGRYQYFETLMGSSSNVRRELNLAKPKSCKN